LKLKHQAHWRQIQIVSKKKVDTESPEDPEEAKQEVKTLAVKPDAMDAMEMIKRGGGSHSLRKFEFTRDEEKLVIGAFAYMVAADNLPICAAERVGFKVFSEVLGLNEAVSFSPKTIKSYLQALEKGSIANI